MGPETVNIQNCVFRQHSLRNVTFFNVVTRWMDIIAAAYKLRPTSLVPL